MAKEAIDYNSNKNLLSSLKQILMIDGYDITVY